MFKSWIASLENSIQPFTDFDSGSETDSEPYAVLLIVYLTGATLFFVRLCVQTIVIVHLAIRNKIRIIDGLHIVLNDKYGLPFSFFRWIFINPKFHKQDDLKDILSHERVHVEQYHWVDLLFVELLTVIFWFNPFIWLFERSIKQNHEYLADRGVLRNGLELSRYQALLINQLMGMQIIGVTNNLNFALNTNRLKMMTKNQSKKIRSVRLFIALPVLFILMAAFARPEYVYVPDNEPEVVARNFLSSENTREVKGMVETVDGVPLFGASVIVKGTNNGTIADQKGQFVLQVPDDEQVFIVISFVGFISEEITVPQNSAKAGKIKMKRGQVLIDTDNVEKILSTPPPTNPTPEATAKDGDEVFVVVEDMPAYPGGYYALMQYYSEKKKEFGSKLKGKVLVGFTVDAKGKVVDIKVIEKDNNAVAQAAYALVQGMKNWNPGKQRGKAVSVDFAIPVVFD